MPIAIGHDEHFQLSQQGMIIDRHTNVCKGQCVGKMMSQPRPQGLPLDDFQNGGSTGEDPGQR